ncbi:MAG: ABC transporter ATP-binding protein [candidate division WOR-3 bacterium]
MKVLEIDSIVKIYRSPFLLKKIIGVNNLSMEIEEGEIFGLLGPNGAGKTTTLKIITGLIRPTKGKIKLFESLEPLYARRKIGFLPENPSFYPHLTGRELLEFYAKLYGKKVSKKEIDNLLEMVGLSKSIGKRIHMYSKGMIQRIGFAQAIIGDPEFVILDEPLSALDPIGRRELKDLIVEINKQGKTILFSSHILPDVEAICSRVGIIFNGKMKKVGAIKEILEEKINYIEIEFEGIKEPKKFEKYGEMKVEKGTVFLRVKNEKERDKVIKEVIKKKGKILSVSPIKKNLEEYFIKIINE